MLKKEWISKIEMHSDEWHQGRLGRFTSSEIHCLMGEKPFTQGALSYIYRKCGEDVSGVACRDEVDNSATRWGLLHENEGLKIFGQKIGIKFLVTQKLIREEGSRFSSTPDALIVHGESSDQTAYNVSTVEIKSPISYDAYIGLFLCDTPAQLKKENKAYYFQCLDQMDNCDALKGYFVCWQPLFKMGGMKIIEFRKIDLVEDFKLLRERKRLAVEKFNEIRDKLISN